MFFLSCLPQEGSKLRLLCPLTDKESDGGKGQASREPSDNPARNGRASTCKVAGSEVLLLNEMVFIRHWQLSGGKWINKHFPLGHFPTVLDLYLQMFKEFPFTWGFMTVIIARAERKLPSIWLLLLQRAVQKPCHLNHRTETLWRKTNAAFFSLKKNLLNCLEKPDSDLQKSFLLGCLASGRRGQITIMECLSGSSWLPLKVRLFQSLLTS